MRLLDLYVHEVNHCFSAAFISLPLLTALPLFLPSLSLPRLPPSLKGDNGKPVAGKAKTPRPNGIGVFCIFRKGNYLLEN